jgi:hypothetical protein
MWDPSRQHYYTYDPQDKIYIYQDGSKLDESGRALDPPPYALTFKDKNEADVLVGVWPHMLAASLPPPSLLPELIPPLQATFRPQHCGFFPAKQI